MDLEFTRRGVIAGNYINVVRMPIFQEQANEKAVHALDGAHLLFGEAIVSGFVGGFQVDNDNVGSVLAQILSEFAIVHFFGLPRFHAGVVPIAADQFTESMLRRNLAEERQRPVIFFGKRLHRKEFSAAIAEEKQIGGERTFGPASGIDFAAIKNLGALLDVKIDQLLGCLGCLAIIQRLTL